MTNTIPSDIANTIVQSSSYERFAPIDEAFKWLRHNMPLAVAEADGFDPFWVVTKHAHLLEIERNAEVFRNSPRSSVAVEAVVEQAVRQQTGGDAAPFRTLIHVDGDEHRALRAITFPSFTPRSIAGIEGKIREIAKSFVARLDGFDGACDFAKDFAFLYPLRVIMTVLGVPQEDEAWMLKMTQEIFSNNDPDLNRSGTVMTPEEGFVARQQIAAELHQYFGAMTEKFRAEPQDCVNSLIANAKIDGDYLSLRQLMGYYVITATAGHDTTSNTIAAGMWALAERPELLAQLKENPGAIGSFIEESVRWGSPVKHFMRTAAQDCEIGGQLIKEGDWLMLAYHSANRDEDVFEDAYEFNAFRRPNKQIGFGYGPHVCLGQHLARMEMKILWEELLPRLKSVDLAGEPLFSRSIFVSGPKTVPIQFTLN